MSLVERNETNQKGPTMRKTLLLLTFFSPVIFFVVYACCALVEVVNNAGL